jgi:hypothetical protein
MGFRGLYSAILAMGFTQMTPAIAQLQAPLHEAETAPSAVAPASAIKAIEQQPLPTAPANASSAAGMVSATQAAKPEPVDPADKDLATAPPEEMRPAVIDPNARRPVVTKTATEAPSSRVAPQHVLAAAAPAIQPAGEEQEGYAERVTAAEHALETEVGGDAAFARDQRVATSQWRATPAPRPVQATAEPARTPVRDEQESYPAPAQDQRVAITPLRAMPDDRGDRDAQPAYDDQYREGPPAYAAQDRDTPRGYGDRDAEDGARYAIQDRIGPDGPIRTAPEDQQWTDRQRAPIADKGENSLCDSARTDRLQQRIRQEAARDLIDPRAAQDLNDETGHAEDLRRSYCASGMNDWREERLDRQYAQIEDRIRYEEDQIGRR